MYAPLWFLLGACALIVANCVVDMVGFLRRHSRHHDHLIPSAPRSYRAAR